MPMTQSNRRRKKKAILVVFLATLISMTSAHFATIVTAQDSWPLENSFSPLVSFPMLRGEAKFSLFVPTLQNGQFEDSYKEKLDLKSFYNIKPSDSPFTDVMVRFQLGRFSSRTHYEWNEFFAGSGASTDRAIDFSGFRQGFDVDIFLGNKSRVGFNIDCSFYGPVFTVTGNRVTGPQHSWTTGVHGLYNPAWNIFGMSAVAEGWARWPIGGASVTDYQVSGGLKWPDTVLGSFSIQVGYRSTSLSFAENSKGNVNATWGGVFGSLAYYYH